MRLSIQGRSKMRRLCLLAIFVMGSQGAFGGDVIVAAGGEVMIYYRDRNDIVVRNCGSDYPVINKRSDCTTVGQENRVPVAVFKSALQFEFLISDADKLKPLTADEVKAYRQADSGQLNQLLDQQKKELDAKLARIQDSIKNYGRDSKTGQDLASTTKLLADVKKELTTAQGGAAAIQKVNELIDDIVDKKIAFQKLTSVSSALASDQAVYTLLKQFDASKPECGTDEIIRRRTTPQGTSGGSRGVSSKEKPRVDRMPASAPGIDARMDDCQNISSSTKSYTNKNNGQTVIWKLVSRKRDPSTGKFYEVWQDSSTRVLWGDRLDSHSDQSSAQSKCNGTEGKRAVAGISEKTFELPTKKDFKDAIENGILEVLPNLRGHWFLSSLVSSYNDHFAWGFDSSNGGIYGDYRRGVGSVRCVAR